MAESAAATPNAVEKPTCSISQPTVVEPVPMPVSNAARMAPKAAPRRARVDVAHHVGDKHRIGGAEADAEQRRRGDERQARRSGGEHRQAGRNEDQARHEDPAIADAVGQRARERARDEDHDGERRQVAGSSGATPMASAYIALKLVIAP